MDNRHSIFKTKSLVLLAAGLVMTVAWAVGATGWTKDLDIVAYIGLGSIVIGLMLARSILPGTIAHLFSIIIGAGWSFWMTARLFPVRYTWLERWGDLVIRLNRWYDQAIQGGVSHDNMMFILQMGLIVWGAGYLTIWFLFRSTKVWQAIVPGGLVLIINLYYAPNDLTFWFLIYLLLSLLLVIRFNLLNQEETWRAEGVFFQSDINFDFLRYGLIFSALVIGFAWITPPVVTESPGLLDEFQGRWHDFQSKWNRLYADLNYRDSGGVGTFGQSLMLGGPRQLTEESIMDVKVEGPARYWRATVYDEYDGFGWHNTDQQTAAFGPQAPLSLPIFAARWPVTQTYTFYHDGSVGLYAMSNPISLARSAKVTFNAIPVEQSLSSRWPNWPDSEGPRVEEITYIRSNAAVDKGESYQVVSAVSQATVERLEQAGTDYPAWVTERYLQLPDTITERTRQLARELTAPFDNPFARAQAVESYLRAEIQYNEQIALPPPNVDKVDYILFELKEAYCDYYASAMVVLLRSVGIPARLAAGFAYGDYDSERGVFHVVNADAHSWVEVYFPQYGWIEFEPTTARPVIVRPTASEEDPASEGSNSLNPDDWADDRFPGGPDNIPIDEDYYGEAIGSGLPVTFKLPWLGTQITLPRSVVKGGVSFISVVLVIGAAVAGFWWYQQQAQAAQNIFKLYRNMIRLAGWMGAALRSWQTPYEHATVLQHHLPTHQREIETITSEYVYQTFSPSGEQKKNVPAGERRRSVVTTLTWQSSLAWRHLRPEMIKAIIRRRLPW
jgi:transglutaminase-like putative cysteine protease